MKAKRSLLNFLLLLSSAAPAVAQVQFSSPNYYPVGNSPVGPAVGDFNGDGKKDLVVVNTADQTVSILLGNGDGTFQPAVNYACGATCQFVVVGDFNDDGKLDLALSNQGANTVSILLGNGDGTFQSAMQYATGISADYVVAADFNNDKKLDLLVSTWGSISILFGNGDGTFQSPVTTSSIGGALASDYMLAVGDFNGDGKLDVATGNALTSYASGNLIILLGNGDGTFQTPLTSPLSFVPLFFAAIDFNDDGKLDLGVFGTSFSKVCHNKYCESYIKGYLSALLGNGDGSFAPSFTAQVTQWNNVSGGTTPQGLAIADLNNDGKPDMADLVQAVGPDACGYADVGGIDFALGNGDGTFQVSGFVSANEAFSFAVGDVNGDTLPDLIAANNNFCGPPPPPNTVSIFLNTTPSNVLSLTIAGNGSGTVMSQPPILNCKTSCSGNFAPGTTVTLTATANSTSIFTGWTGVCSGTGTCTITMNAAESVTATFIALFPLSVALAGNGGGSITSSPAGINCGSTCTANFVSGTTVTLTAAPNATSNFTGWSGACSGTGTCTITMNAATSVSAAFNMQDFSISPASATLSLQPGSQGTDVMTLAGVNGPFSSAIQLSCAVTGPAPKPSCALSPASVTPGSSSAASTLTITATSTAGMHFPFSPLQHGRPIYALWMPLMLGIIFLGGTNKRREKFGLFCVLLVLLFFQIACGGGSSNSSHTPPPTNYTVTVTGTSGGTQHATTVAVTVQ